MEVVKARIHSITAPTLREAVKATKQAKSDGDVRVNVEKKQVPSEDHEYWVNVYLKYIQIMGVQKVWKKK